MAHTTHCVFCEQPLDAGRELVFEFESLNYIDDEELLERIRNDSRYYWGEPLPTCVGCARSLEQNRLEREEDRLFDETSLPRLHRIFLISTAVIFALALYFHFFGSN